MPLLQNLSKNPKTRLADSTTDSDDVIVVDVDQRRRERQERVDEASNLDSSVSAATELAVQHRTQTRSFFQVGSALISLLLLQLVNTLGSLAQIWVKLAIVN